MSPILHLAELSRKHIRENIQNYTCKLVRRERVSGALTGPETIFAKVRHMPDDGDSDVTPFRVYLKFESPKSLRGREVLFSTADQEPQLLVRNGGPHLGFLTLQLVPDCPLALKGNLYPITEFGISRLVERMIHLGHQELQHGECEVTAVPGCQTAERTCLRVEIRHPVCRPHFRYHLVRVYIDEDLLLPIRFESYEWPSEVDGEPLLKEEYTYHDLRTNVALTDLDFDRRNPDYGFAK